MADISKITLSNGKTYNIKDTVARSIQGGTIRIVGTTTTSLFDEATTNPIIVSGNSYTAVPNDAVFFGKKEFVFDGDEWHEFGDMTGLGNLSTKDNASGTYTPAGTVSQPTFSGSQMSLTGTFTPSGSVGATVDNTGNYQPAGTVSTPTISVKTAGTTETINSITNVGTLPTLTMEVDDTTETLEISFSQGTLPTKSANIVVKTGDAEYQASAPSFTGTKVQLGFTGTEGNISVSGTPAGTVSQPTFTGTQATITVS